MNRISTFRTGKLSRSAYIAVLAWGLTGGVQEVAAQKQLPVVQQLQVKPGSLANAIRELQQQSGISIVYDATALNTYKVSQHDYSNQSVTAILSDLLASTNLQFSEKDGVIVIKASNKNRIPVNGTVTDAETGAPLPGVSVQVRNPVAGSVTNATGQFTLSADPAHDTLLLSYVGYKSIRTALNGRKEVTVQLKADANMLSSVVVVGYGESKKGDVTGAINHISSKDFNVGVVSSPDQLLQGKVPGLNITRSGDPNATAAVILRGPSTLRSGEAQEPFYVIDGVPGASIQLVAPQDIESMTVLKDAASTAIYGARAANGVIMVTTRRAKAGQNWINYNSYVATEQVSNSIEMLSGDELRKYVNDNGKSFAPSDDDGANTNWQKEVTRTGVSHNHNLSLGGGHNNTSYNASINYLKNDGIMKGSSMERVNIRANLEQKAFNEKLKLNFSLSNIMGTQYRIPLLVFQNMLTYLPTVNIRNEDGSFKEDFSRTRNYLNPVALIETNEDRQKNKIMLGNIRADLDILPGLTYTLNVSMQDEQINRDIYYGRASGLSQKTNGQAIRSAFTNNKKILETYVNYGKTFGAHDLRLLAGYSWQEDRRNDGFQASNKGFVSDALAYNNLALGTLPAGDIPNYGNTSIDIYRFISFYGRANYTYANKYLLQVSARRDGSSVFGTNNRWGLFPAVSAAWRMKEESFLKNVSWLDDLKLRAGYGVSGNALGFNSFIAILRYTSTGLFYYNGNIVTAIGPSQNANRNLKWESTGMANIGADFSFLGGRLGGSVDVYDKRTSDLIWTYNVPTTQYFVNTLTANAGEISNKGIEVQINAIPVQLPKFSWRTSVNLAYNKNVVSSLSNDIFKLTSINTAELGGKGQSGIWSQQVVEGQPLGAFYTWKYMGKDKDGITQMLKKDGTVTTEVSTDNFFYSGNAQPKLIYGWNNNFSYGNFDLNVFVRGVTGNKIMNATLAGLNNPTEAAMTNIAKFTEGESINDINAHLRTDRFIENGSYLRLDNATLGYNVPVRSKYISSLRFHATATNLFVITSYRGIDPEINMGGLTPGVDNNNFYPKTRSFLFGVNVNF
ncbi:TonB-dependent receptor [Chitinophaga rhizophila]|uniref:TonB-dependent receptor n=1 Tax=Chitinophaga rhizophila TaxID=2866212 RepID=A0ABS7GF58_9BACT|nr:TonB-dependent receptor [Chitinophaga rhizophila]MBW8686314.1 TonB-dependent receptor [Chitinophaga rhizophila]